MTAALNKARLIVAFTQQHFNDEKFSDFFDYNDLGVPLAISYMQGHVVLRPEGEKTLLETWSELCSTLNVDPLGKYESLEDLVSVGKISLPKIDIQLSIDWNNDGHRAFMSGDADKALYFWNQASLFGQPNAITSLLWLNLLLNRFDERHAITDGYVERTNNWRAQYDALAGDPAIGASQFESQKPAASCNSALMAWLAGEKHEAMAYLILAGDGVEAEFLRKLIDDIPVNQMGLDENQVTELIGIYGRAIENFERIKSFDSSPIQETDGMTFVQFATESVALFRRPIFYSVDQLISHIANLDLESCFRIAKYADYSDGVIEELATRFYGEFLNEESKLVRFAFYGALYSLPLDDQRLFSLREEILVGKRCNFIAFLLDELDSTGTRNNMITDFEIKNLRSTEPRSILSTEELNGREIAYFHSKLTPYSNDLNDFGVDPILAVDFVELVNLKVVTFNDFFGFYEDLSYPKALYLAIANPFIVLDFELPHVDTRTFFGQWEFEQLPDYAGEICAALPDDLKDIFQTTPRVQTFFSMSRVIDEAQDGTFEWDPYRSILFTRNDFDEKLRASYLLGILHDLENDGSDEPHRLSGAELYDAEIACLYETNSEIHLRILELGSELLNLALLLNPSISALIRERVVTSGVKIEFADNFDSLTELVELAETYGDTGLAVILRAL